MYFIKLISIIITLSFISNSVFAAPITSLEVTGGSFTLSSPSSGSGDQINPGAFSNITIGGYDGSALPPNTSDLESNYATYSIATFNTGVFGAFGIYTAEIDDASSGYAPVTGEVIDNVLTLDLSSWTANWNSNNINLGSSSDLAENSVCAEIGTTGSINCTTAIVTTYDVTTGSFTANWDTVHQTSSFTGSLSHFEITGFVSTVPVPSASWLISSGLIGLLVVAKKSNIWQLLNE